MGASCVQTGGHTGEDAQTQGTHRHIYRCYLLGPDLILTLEKDGRWETVPHPEVSQGTVGWGPSDRAAGTHAHVCTHRQLGTPPGPLTELGVSFDPVFFSAYPHSLPSIHETDCGALWTLQIQGLHQGLRSPTKSHTQHSMAHR